jgi:6,7-dimethyl-8-ribityllumazine synthase
MREKKIAIVVSRFNPEVTDGLVRGALETLMENGISQQNIDTFDAPGAFELPLLAQEIAKTNRYQAVIALGCVIKGDTAHFEYISQAAAVGLMQAGLQTGVPISFGVLTTYTDEQALVRSRPGPENKGRESALAVLQAASVIKKLKA